MFKPENTSRKIDHLGRITIPKGLRDRMGISLNDELEVFTAEENGRAYIALSRVEASEDNSRYIVAAEVLDELGFKVPEVLMEKARG